MMTKDRWRLVEHTLGGALELAPERRSAFLDTACAGDEALRAEVESLLAAEDAAGAAADRALHDAVAGAAAHLLNPGAPVDLQEGDRIGPYRIVRELGRGGMGTVYLAERDDQFNKHVAIKLVSRGMDTSDLVGRFREERQILAHLDHPYVARLLDGGSTPDGRPYLVMEHVEGTPITAYCSAHGLGLRPRLELFRKVCAAVQSAHQKLVVHRDLKPGNILVDTGGSPKLLDFGIAKLLDPGEAPQATVAPPGQRRFTPEYASPEQVRGEPISTATDVYSLGAVLYELLTGAGPHRIQSNTSSAIERAICVDEPAKPNLARDLDNIILMALQKNPARRYASVAELSDDLQRYLQGHPVHAREATVAYRARRFIGRHQAGVAAAVLLVASLAGGIAVSTAQARRAERRSNEVRRLARAVVFDMHDAIRDLQGATKARALLVNTAVQYFDGLALEAAGDAGIQLELAEAYFRVGELQGSIGSSLGRIDDALVSYRKAVAIADALAAADPDDLNANVVRMKARDKIGEILARRRGDIRSALQLYSQAVAIGEELRVRDPLKREYKQQVGSLYVSIARDETDSAKAVESARKALPILLQLAADPEDHAAQMALSEGYSMIGKALTYANDLQGALAALQQAVRIRERLLESQPLNAPVQRDLMIAYSKIGDLMGPYPVSLQNPAGAVEYYGKTQAIAQRLAAADPDNPRAAFDLGMAIMKTGLATPSPAVEDLLRALVVFERLSKLDTSDRRAEAMAASVHVGIAQRQRRGGDETGAISHYRAAIRIHEHLLAANPKDLQSQRSLWRGYQDLARVQAGAFKRSDAIELAQKAIATARASRGVDPTNAVTQAMLPEALATWGSVLATLAAAPGVPATQARDDWRLAADAYRQSAAGWSAITPQNGLPKDRDAQLALARREEERATTALATIR